MTAILPIASLLVLVAVIHQFAPVGWRAALLFGLVAWGAFIAVLSEILSLFHALQYSAILAAWLVSLLLLMLALFWGLRRYGVGKFNPALAAITDFEFYLLTATLAIILVVGLAGLIYPPNNVDSMTYHMSRVMHWMQNGSLDFYPTANLRQLHQSPWAEYAIVHLQILNGGGDLFANFIQWLCMVGYIIGASLIAAELGAARRGQVFAAAVCATLPMGILQGSTTQTDAVVALWLVCFVYFVLQLRKQPNWLSATGAGLALGLSLLTKATAYIFAFPFLIWLVVSLFKNKAPKKWLILGLVAALTLLLNTGVFLRNYALYHHPLGPRQEEAWGTYANELFTPAALASNLVRNASLHFSTPLPWVNLRTERAVDLVHELIGVSPNDERTTWMKAPFAVPQFSTHEDSAGNLAHTVLFLAMLIFYLARKPRDGTVGIYLLLIAGAFILFAGYLKWQPWNSRLHLPLFVLLAPFVGLMLARLPAPKVVVVIFFLLLAGAVPFLVTNQTRPLIGVDIELRQVVERRAEQYFNNHPEMAAGYFAAAETLRSLECTNVGLISGPDSFEYPLWAILSDNFNKPVRIEHVNVDNVSQGLAEGTEEDFCALVTIDPKNAKVPAQIRVGEKVYSLAASSEKKKYGMISVYRRN